MSRWSCRRAVETLHEPGRAHVCRVEASVRGFFGVVDHNSEASVFRALASVGLDQHRRSLGLPESEGARRRVVAVQDDLEEAQHLAQSCQSTVERSAGSADATKEGLQTAFRRSLSLCLASALQCLRTPRGVRSRTPGWRRTARIWAELKLCLACANTEVAHNAQLVLHRVGLPV